MANVPASTSFARVIVAVAISSFGLAACSQEKSDQSAAPATDTANTTATAPATNAAAPAPSADDVTTLSGAKFADFKGDATKGEADFATCKTCHAIEAGVNKTGPSLHGIIGRKASTVAGYTYSAANHASGITWTPEKLFQYLENPQRVVPGTKMAFAGWSDPQKRADVIAYLEANANK